MGILLVSALHPGPLFAEEDSQLTDLSLDQLINVEIKSDITSVKAKPIREQPGIISVVTEKQISEAGARDLSDILMLVPGFSLDTDVESAVGLTFRGLQGQEGKVLLLVDGLEVNEPLYGSLPILNHIPAEMIQQVEIVRGPGPAQYGGSAGLAVIRVTTKGAGLDGGYVTVTPAYAAGRFAENYAVGAGYTTNDWRFSFNGSYSDTFISNQKYTSLSGTNVVLTHNSAMNPLLLDVGAGWRDLDFRFIYDAYNYYDSVYYGDPPVTPVDTRFDSILTSVKYDAQVNDWLKITPEFTYRHQMPWYVKSTELGNWNVVADRYQADLTGVAELTKNSALLAGMRYFRDTANAIDTANEGIPAPIYYKGQPTVSYNDIAGFAQYDLDLTWVNLSIGGRYENHDAVGGHFVPRIALTKAWSQFHLKALYSQASRIPAINVLKDAVGGKLEAEQTANYELEAGYQFTDSLSWTANVFYMEVNQPIIYSANALGASSDGYHNGTKLSTAGLESELRWDQPDFSASLNCSYYRAVDNDIAYVQADPGNFLAAPSYKVAANITWHINPKLDWNINGFWLGEMMAYAYPASGPTTLPSEFVLNTFLNYQFQHFSVGIGASNLLDQDRYAPQPYAGGSGPLPLMGREFFAKLTFKF